MFNQKTFFIIIFCLINFTYGQINNNCDSEDYYPCNNGQCIEIDNFCDGKADCKDYSDETEFVCKERICPRHAFQCKYGACIGIDLKCNNVLNCFDGSDEDPNFGCKTCPSDDYFKCKSGHCILVENICDGKGDCGDGSDETDDLCKTQPICNNYQFTCKYGACIPNSEVCDGVSNCVDNSDEMSCSNNTCAGQSHFRCRYGGCIDVSLRCNGKKDCFDGSDEDTYYSSCTKIDNLDIRFFNNTGKGHCVVPDLDHMSIFYQDKSLGKLLKPKSLVEKHKFITYECENRPSKPDKYQMREDPGRVYCEEDGWTAPHPKCLPTCNRQVLNAVTYQSKCDEGLCPNVIFPNVSVHLECNFGYLEQENRPPLQKIHCDKDGEWDYQPPRCIPDCGVKHLKPVGTSSNAKPIAIEEVPWHVGIYYSKENKAKHEHLCGGTIINAIVVLSAAHCFSLNNVNVKESDKQYFKVLAGKYTRAYIANEPNVQFFTIEELVVPEGFQGISQNYLYDYALILLNRPIKLTTNVRPICIDQVDIKVPVTSNVGMVAGWGEINANRERPNELMAINLTTVDYSECIKTDNRLRNTVTGDKFCVIYDRSKTQGQVCHGDSGGGFVIKKKDRYYLRGVLSNTFSVRGVNLECGQSTHATFTNIAQYINVIDEYVKKKGNNPI